MNELIISNAQLPDTIEDLATYDRYYTARQPTYRKLLRNVKDWEEASEEEKRILRRAQDEAEYLIDIRVKLGELYGKLPEKRGRKAEEIAFDDERNSSPKKEFTQQTGLSDAEARRYAIISRNPKAVEQAKEKAKNNNDVVTQAQILQEIKEQANKPHVVNNSGDNEWYTPAEYIEAARSVMGSIDLDPASNDFANKTVKAKKYYTEETNGLLQKWSGNIWLNPPYSSGMIKQFVDKLVESNFRQAVILVNNATETAWFRRMIEKASAIVFTTGRIRFEKVDGVRDVPLQGQAFIYCGDYPDKFLDVFKKYGWGCKL